MKHSPLLLIILSTFFTACEKEIKLDEQDIKTRMVLNSVFSDGDTIKIHLSESRSVLHNNGGDLPNITDAVATLHSSSGNLLGTFTHENDGFYKLYGFYPQIDEQYTLKATHPNFDDISAKSYAPQFVNVINIDTISKNEELELTISIDDPLNEENYYSIALIESVNYISFEDGVETEFTDNYTPWICTNDINAETSSSDIDGYNCGQELFLSDKTFNGETYNFKLSYYYYNNLSESTVYILTKSLSKDLFKYRVSLQKYEQNDGNPFGEPVQVYSNVENGFGIFSGYSEKKDSIIF